MSALFHIHTTCALLSISLFMWRGIAMWRNQPLTNKWLRRALPDSVDTLFLGTGITMAWSYGLSPLEEGWLLAKVFGLVTYIILGAVALKYSQNMKVKKGSFVMAVLVFAYIVSVAVTKQVVPFTG